MMRRWLNKIGFGLVVFVMMTPAVSVFLWMLSLSLKNEVDNLTYPPVFIPSPPTFANFRAVFEQNPFALYFWNSIVVSGLAMGHLAALRLSTVLNREVRIALVVALSCAILGAAACGILIHNGATHSPTVQSPPGTEMPQPKTLQPFRLVFAFGAAMFSAIMVATTLGLLLPILFRRLGIDPAISSGPLVTTANDSISVAIYMTLAVMLAG